MMSHPIHNKIPPAANRWFVLVVNAICILTLLPGYQWVMHSLQMKPGTIDWSVFEILANYEGGFIRRGLLGELLHWAVTTTHIDIRILMGAVLLPPWIFVAGFMIRKFRQYGIRWWLLVIIGYCLLPSVIRKDFIIYTLFIAILYIYRSRHSATVRIAAISVISVIMLLIYETSIFMCLGFIAIVTLSDKSLNRFARLIYPAVLCITMLLLLKSTGNVGAGDKIMVSWRGIIPDSFIISQHIIDSLGWTVNDSLNYNRNLMMPEFHPLLLVKYVLFIILIPYIYITYMYVDTYRPKPSNSAQKSATGFPYKISIFTTLYIFFLLCMLPLFYGLSCDYGRMLMHATLSSLCVAFILPEKVVVSAFPQWALNIGGAVSRLFTRIPHSVYSITILMLLFTPAYSFHYSPDYLLFKDSLLIRIYTDTADMAQILFSHL